MSSAKGVEKMGARIRLAALTAVMGAFASFAAAAATWANAW
jgi:hypothetical protein